VKILASPGNLGDHPKLDALPKQRERMGIDILAPQDYGGRSMNVNEALNLVRKNAGALERVGRRIRETGVSLWSNCGMVQKRGQAPRRNPFSGS